MACYNYSKSYSRFLSSPTPSPRSGWGTDAQQHLANLPEPSDAGSSPQLDAAISRRILELVRAEFEERTWDAFWRTAVEGQSPSDVGVGIVDRIGKIGRLTICRREFGQRDSLRTRIVRIQEP